MSSPRRRLRAYLIDDEELALKRLVRLLEKSGRVDIAGSSTDPEQALAEVAGLRPDVLFLDIQMPGLNAFEFLGRLAAEPLIVFATAYDQYALRAFEVNSIDYLLKPVEMERLERTLDRMERLSRQPERDGIRDLLSRLAPVLNGKTAAFPERLPSRVGERIQFVETGAVTHFYAKDKLTFAATAAKDYVIDGSILELEDKLDPSRFVRIHRGILLNLAFVQEVGAWFGGRLLVRLNDGKKTELIIARDRVKEFREKLRF
jgi:two-component system, LytTR family, response regulator